MSLRTAINEKCRQCTYDPANGGTWRQQTDECTAISCPLHPVRPRPYVARAAAAVGPNRANPEREAAA